MNTKNKTFKKELSYYTNLYLLDMMNKVKPIQDQKKPISGSETIHNKIIKVVEAASLVASVFVLCCSVWIVLTEFIKLFS